MATVAPSADQASDLLQTLSLEGQPKALDLPEPTKKSGANQFGSVDTANTGNGQIQPYDRSVTPLLPDFVDTTMCYLPNGYPYYFGGYKGTGNDWDEFSRYVNAEGVDMTSGYYGDNGSLVYHPGYSYAPYGPYSPATSPVPGNDQLYGTQHYHYPSHYFQSMNPTSSPYTPSLNQPAKGDVTTSAASDQKPLPVEPVNGNANGTTNAGKGNNRSAPLKSTNQKSSYNSNGSFARGSLTGGVASAYQDPRFGFDGLHSPIPWLDGPVFSDGQSGPATSSAMNNSFSNTNNGPASRNQPYRPNSHYVGLHHPRPISGMAMGNGYMNRMYQNKLYGQYGSVRSGIGFGATGYDSRANGRGWLAVDKFKNRGHNNGFYGYSNDNMDGMNELNRGPRSKSSKNQKGFMGVTLAVKGQNLPSSGTNEEEKMKSSATPDRDQFNKADFPEEYTNAKFFIIKSYSEDDVHKSMKYNVWASTPNGNKKLDAAYKEAQEKAGGCPVFLFFSVNTSGQFLGVAEMIGPVDFHKNVEYWQQDKWNGCFPVKWHIVKDVPNSSLKHITLENNENKPVTNSRDTQEVKVDQGVKIIKIFKEHTLKTCLLDDFEFYENRQKSIQEKKAKQQQFQKQVWEGKTAVDKKEMENGDLKSQKSSEVALDLVSNTTSIEAVANGDLKLSDDGIAVKAAVPEKVVANGVANAC